MHHTLNGLLFAAIGAFGIFVGFTSGPKRGDWSTADLLHSNACFYLGFAFILVACKLFDLGVASRQTTPPPIPRIPPHA